MAQPKSRVPLAVGLTAAAGVGYYLYQSGGNAKVAEKKFEADLSSASSRVKGELPGRGKEAEKTAAAWATEKGQQIDNVAEKARNELNKTGESLDSYRKEAGKEAMAKVDKFDATVEKEAAKAKSGISGWFGGSSK
ncbi:hypothetical protein V492_04763 [Pseudogymnoascus sp. VKM F-4246]|nr:hypothetical protein V492_04763 [Pseudogymnoascus sp. VKM F-4246]